jgi:hypothetical protein
MFHPSALCTVIFDSLSEAQQEAAAGRFSDPNVLHETEVTGTISYFTKELSATVRQVIQSRSKALLFTKKASFKILSSPTLNLDTITSQPVFISHDGNTTRYPSPITIPVKDATDDVKVLIFFSSDPDDPSTLHELASETPITNTLTNEDPTQPDLTFPFPDPTTTFANWYVAGLPACIPLPSGHDLEPVPFHDTEGVETFITKLQAISNHNAEWAMAMYKAHEWFEGSSLDVASLNVPDTYSIGTPNSNTYRNTIHIPTSTIYPTSINGQNLIRCITHAKNENIDRWFKANPDT